MSRKTISILTPCYNEEPGIAHCYERIREIFATELPGYDYEHVFIDNCSVDRTVEILKAIAAADRRVKIIVNSRNFGAARSSFHGLLETRGHAVVPVLADLQTPPEILPELVAKWEQGCPMVVAVRTGADEGWFIRQCRKMFYRLMSRFSGVQQIPDFIGFGLYDARVVQVMRDLREPDPYFRGMVCEIGFEKAFVEYHQPPRRHGKTSYTFVSLLDYAVLGLTSLLEGTAAHHDDRGRRAVHAQHANRAHVPRDQARALGDLRAGPRAIAHRNVLLRLRTASLRRADRRVRGRDLRAGRRPGRW